MKNKYILSAALVTLFATVAANAQEGFGTNSPDPSSVIEMKSAKRGVLIPRVDLTATNLAVPVIAPANSLMVYNKATAGTGATGVTPGFYYWFVDPSNDPTKDRWIRITNAEDIIKGNITSSDLNVTGGTDATFTNVTLDIKNGAVTTVKIAPKAVTEDKMVAPALSTGTPATIRIPIAQNDGTVAYGAFPATGVTGDNLTPYTNATTDVVPSIDIPNGGTGAVLVSTSLRVANGGITTGKLANDAVTSGKILDGEVKLADLDANSVDSSKIVNESILSEDIKDGEITSADIKDLTITGVDIAGNTITSDKLNSGGAGTGTVPTVNSDGSVTYQTISTDATNVTNAKNLTAGDTSVAIGGITNGVGATLVPVSVMVAANGITTDKIKDGDVKLADLDANSVDSSKIVNESILSEDIKDGEVKTADLAADAVTNAKLADNAVQTENIKDDSVTADKMNAGSVATGSPIRVPLADNNGDITYGALPAASITGADLTNGGDASITIGGIGAGALLKNASVSVTDLGITNEKLANNAVNSIKIANETILSEDIKDGEVKTADLGADAVDNSKLADNAVQTENIAANAVETSDIKDGAVTVLKLNSGSALIGKVATANGAGGVTYETVKAADVSYVNTTSGLTATNVQAAIDQIIVYGNTQLNNNNLTDEGDGKVTLTRPNGTKAKVNKSDLSYNSGTGVYTFTNGDTTDTTFGGGDVNSTDLTVTGGTDATFTNVTLDIKPGAVTNVKLAADAVKTGNIENGTILGADIATKTISADKLIADGVNDAGKVATVNANGTVTYQTVAADAANVTNGKALSSTDLNVSSPEGATALLQAVTIDIKAGAVTDTKLATGAVTTTKIVDDAVTAAKINTDVAGTGLTQNTTSGALELAIDGVKAININADVAGAGLTQNSSTGALEVNAAGITTGKNLTNGGDTSITIGGVAAGVGALLKDATVAVATDGITTVKIADKNVTPAKVQPGTSNQVLATNNAGTDVIWVNKSTLAIEPWLIQAATPTVQGSAYTDNLTTNGTIAIKKAQVQAGAILDVSGAVRGGVNTAVVTVGANSAAFGNANTASGISAFAAGASNTASGAAAVAAGTSNTASGANAVALGQSNSASAANTTALGQSNNVSAANATALGQTNTASGNGSTVGGFTNTASTIYETVFGRYNAITTPTTGGATTWNAADPLFQIGNGSAVGTRNNALTILKSGFTGLGLTGATSPTERFHVAAGNVRINDIVTTTGATSDKIVVADTNGVLKTISALSAIGAGDITGGTEITVGNGTDSAFKDVTLGIATNAITNAKMADDAIGSAEIINNSITVDDIGTAAVGTDELVADAVTTGKILNGTILGEDISTKTITADKLDATGSTPGYVATVGAGGIVTYAAPTADAANISNGQALTAADGTSATIDVVGGSNALLVATSLRVKDNSITNLKLNSGTATNGFVATANGSGGVAYLAPSVNTTNISNAKDLTNGGDTSITIGGAANGVGTLLKDASVSITNLGVTNGKIGPDAITTDKIAADAVQTSDIKDKNVTAAKLDATGITAGYVATANSNGTVTYQQVSTTNLANKGSLTNPTGETPVSITIAGGNNALLSNAQISVANGGVTAAKLTSGTAAANTVATSNGSGVVTYQAITPAMIGSAANLSGAADATPSIEVASGGTNAVLVATTLRVKDGGVTAAKLTSGTAAANTVATSNGSGVVTYQAISPAMIGGTSNLTAADATPSIEVVGGTNAVLSTTSLRVKDGGITSTKILDGTIAAVDMATPGNDKVLTSGNTGTVTWIDKSTLTAEPWQQQGSATAANTNAQNIYQQGNVGIGFTSADPASGSALDVKAGTVRVRTIGAVANAGAAKDKVVVADNTGVLKTVNAAMSKIFYMPAITFDTSVNGTYTKNLYQEYVNQFTGAGNPTLVSSTGAAAIPYYLDPSELYYYVTYYDNTVFTGLSISATGVLTYTVTGPGSPASYMNIVFVVK